MRALAAGEDLHRLGPPVKLVPGRAAAQQLSRLERLRRDLDSGAWQIGHRDLPNLDASLRLIVREGP